jgi:hypothetical protein
MRWTIGLRAACHARHAGFPFLRADGASAPMHARQAGAAGRRGQAWRLAQTNPPGAVKPSILP